LPVALATILRALATCVLLRVGPVHLMVNHSKPAPGELLRRTVQQPLGLRAFISRAVLPDEMFFRMTLCLASVKTVVECRLAAVGDAMDVADTLIRAAGTTDAEAATGAPIAMMAPNTAPTRRWLLAAARGCRDRAPLREGVVTTVPLCMSVR
jgi:hypothetical protein